MKKLLGVFLFLSLFFTCFTIHAGISGFNGSTVLGNVDAVKCGDGVKCAKVLNKLVLTQNVGTVSTFVSGDATPSVAAGVYFNTFTNAQTITMLDDGVAGEEVLIKVKGAITWDVTGTNLKCGSTDIVSASGDTFKWFFDGTDWSCTAFIDATDNLN